MQGIFNRTELLLGQQVLQSMQAKRVIIFGVGGVGSWCAESLVRSGIQHLTIVDSDCVSVSNVNRQLMATTKTVGLVKVNVLRDRLLEINPDADIYAIQEIYSEETNEAFHLDDYDYIIDCIDSLKDKVSLLTNASKTSAKVYSSMGAALKIDPTKIQVAEFWKVRGCPLGAALRKRMKRAKIKLSQKVQCVFSDEVLENKGENKPEEMITNSRDMALPCPPEPGSNPNLENHDWNATKAQINGSLPHITAIFGFTLAGLVLQDINKKAAQIQEENL